MRRHSTPSRACCAPAAKRERYYISPAPSQASDTIESECINSYCIHNYTSLMHRNRASVLQTRGLIYMHM
jgi:hypothetical protein